MGLKIKYQYTYFVLPFIVEERKYSKYLLKLLGRKDFKLKFFQKDKDLDIYTYFTPSVREYMFKTFNLSKTKIQKLEEIPNDTKAAIFAKYPCTIFEYNLNKDVQGKTEGKDGIFFTIPKMEIVCFNTGICFLVIKTEIEESNEFGDLLNFNYKFNTINQEYGVLSNYDKIKIQTDSFENIKHFRNFVKEIIGTNIDSIKLDIDSEKFLTYSYSCIEQEDWNNTGNNTTINIDYTKYVNILPEDNNLNYQEESVEEIFKWKYAKMGITKNGVFLFSSGADMNNFTIFPKEYENQYLYTYILCLYMKIYLKKLSFVFDKGINLEEVRKKFIKFTKNLWIQELTINTQGTIFFQKLKNILEIDNLYVKIKNKYDIFYKELNIEKNTKSSKLMLIAIVVGIILNIINLILVFNK